MNDTIRDRLELLLARIAGNDVDIKTMTPGVVTNLTEKFLMDIARRIDIIEQSGGVDPKLSKMLDVDITSPSDGQALVYDAEIEKWINEAVDDTYNLADMSDVIISSPSSDNILVYNSSSNKWENSGRINSIEAEISSVNSSLSWLNNRVIDAYDRIDDVEDRVSDLEDTDAELLSKIDAILSDLSYVETVASSAIGNEANAFDDAEGTTYSVGDYCIYDNKLYICKRRTSSPQFDNTAWERVNIGDKLKQIKAEIDTVATDALNALNNSNAALTAAASASTDASNAITYSSTAMSNASAAVSTANAALSSASDATDIATTADGNASNALNVANASNVRSQNAIKAIAATYNTSLTYNIGDYCTYNSFLYKCVSDETTGAWDENKWIKVTVGDELLSSVGTQSDWNETDISSSAYIKNKPSIPTVNDATLTIQKNSETVGSFTANASNNETINITVPVNASDVSALPSSTKYGAGISVSINTTDYKVTTILKDQDGNTLGVPQVIDLPIESVVVGGSYDDVNKKIVLTLQNGSTIDISVGDLVSGLQTEITVDNKLASDLIDDSNQSNKFITVAEKNKLLGIESGAEVNIQSDWNETVITSDAYIKNKPSIPSNTSDLTNDSDFVSDASYVHTDNNFTNTLKNKLNNIDAGAEVNVQSDWNETDSTSYAYIQNKPSIPSVGNGKLTIQRNGVTSGEFTANQNSNEIVDIAVPTKTSDITNDTNFVSDASYVHTDNNFTTTLKNKLDGVSAGAEVNVQADWNQTSSSSDAYIKNKPSIPTKTSDLTNDSNFIVDASYVHTDNNFGDDAKNKLDGIQSGAQQNVQSNWNETNASSDAYIKNKPSIPTKTSDITNDSNFVSDASYVHTDNNFTTTLKNKLDGIAAGAEVNVQADWNQNDNTKDNFIKNKPSFSVFKELTTENLNDVKEVGFYVGKAGNSCSNKPSGVVQFGLEVVKLATDAQYYKQILTRPTSQPGDEYVRTCVAGTWGEWAKRVDFSGSYNDLDDKPTIPDISEKVSKSGDTMTGELLSADRSMRIQDITQARVFSIETASGGRVQLHYAPSGNHGIYSYGYGDSLSDTTAFTSSPQWIICRNADGKVFISNWASKGSSTQPIYINNEGSAAACTYSLEKSVPSDAIFTDEKVKIANDTSTNQSLRILLGTSNNDNTVTESVKKSSPLLFNPSTGVFYSPRVVINSTDTSVPFAIRTDGRSSVPQNGDDIALITGAYKKNTTESEKYNNIISLIGNTSDNRSSVRFGSSTGATIITAGTNAKNFPKAYSKHASDALWLAAHSEIHMYTNLTANAASEGGHIKINAGGITVERSDSSVGTTANAYIMLGNEKASSTTKGASKGVVRFYNQNSTGTDTFYVNLDTNTLSGNQALHLPNRSGTLMTERNLTATQIAAGSTGQTTEPSMCVRADSLKSGIETLINNKIHWQLFDTITPTQGSTNASYAINAEDFLYDFGVFNINPNKISNIDLYFTGDGVGVLRFPITDTSYIKMELIDGYVHAFLLNDYGRVLEKNVNIVINFTAKTTFSSSDIIEIFKRG